MNKELKPVNVESEDITTKNIEKLKELFPEILTEKKIDFEKLRLILGDEVDDSFERYNFTWNGKKQAIKRVQQPTTASLKPNRDKSKNWADTQNIYIEGDNLEVLKLLQKSYSHRIKMIYIDPPYNTGKDFVYKDNFHDSMKNYLEQTSQIDGEGNKLSVNTETSGRYHTDWLNMIYPRLKLARNLLAEEGVIFISIDDNEKDNLMKLCDEVFGENNFVGCVIWERAFAPKNDAKYFSASHDFVLVYALNINNFEIGMMPRSAEANARYKNIDNDPRGPWASDNLTVKTYSVEYDYEIKTPSGKIVRPTNGRCWFTNKKKMKELIDNNQIWFGEKGDNMPRLKRFLSDVQQGMVPTTIWKYDEVGHNQEGRQELKKLFDDQGYFDSPKPVRLLRKILRVANVQNDDIILDFFSGSATTAHAVMQSNAENNEKLRFIMVQLPEVLEKNSDAHKAGYNNIPDIAEERLRRAGDNIISEHPEQKGQLDIGFKVFELSNSNIKKWESDFSNLNEQIKMQVENIKGDTNEFNLVYEIMLKQGLDLSLPIEEITVNDANIYKLAHGALFIVLGSNIKSEVATKIVSIIKAEKLEEVSVVIKDTGFANDSEKLNTIETLNTAGVQYDDILSV